MVIFSVISVIPVILLKNQIFGLFANHNRIISQGIPIIILAAIFGTIGLVLMIITKDSLLKNFILTIKNRGKKN